MTTKDTTLTNAQPAEAVPQNVLGSGAPSQPVTVTGATGNASACCGSAVQQSCCEPVAKTACCGAPTTPGSCGCK